MGLLFKLLSVNVLVIAFVVLIVWLAVDYLSAGYFAALMEKYGISPVESHEMFTGAVHRYLAWAGAGAVLLAALLSFLLTRRILGPLMDMVTIAAKIASGDYRGQVPVGVRDEVGDLATAFNSMAESLHRIEQLRKNLVIDVAHELRTPLTNIRGYLEALRDGVIEPSRATVELLNEEALRLAGLVEDILRLARADAARSNLIKTEFDSLALISHALETFLPRFSGKSLHVRTAFKGVDGRVCADEDKLLQVITNILDNALQYTPSGGSVRIWADRTPQRLRVWFANSGGELAQDDLPFIFERFYRGEKSRSRDFGGAGIGLAIARELIEAHNGEVGAELRDGETRVFFSLPL